jgi:hypothetical protein
MKTVVLILTLLCSSLYSFSQLEDIEPIEPTKKLGFGFTLGINNSLPKVNGTLPEDIEFSGSIGYRIGLLAEYRFHSNFSLGPSAALSFNEIGITNYEPPLQITSTVDQVQLEFATHFVYKVKTQKFQPYVFVGPSCKYNLGSEFGASELLQYDTYLALDFGLGLDHPMKHFRILPELHYSYALQDVNVQFGAPNVYIHTLSLLLHFLD